MSYCDDDEIDDELGELGDLNPSGATTRRKKTTGTQALAEFLSTTSPEEFKSNKSKGSSTPMAQRTASAEPSSISFFKLRKSKRALNRLSNNNLINPSKAIFSSIQTSQQSRSSNYNRKNYIEITPKPSSSAVAAATVATGVTASPVLPQMGHHKKRDSSLYSGSLRHSSSIRSQLTSFSVAAATPAAATTANGRMVGRHLIRQDTTETGYVAPNLWNQHQMTLAGGNSNKRRNDIKGTADDQQQRKGLTQALLSTTANMDVIEAGLIQRLERSKLAGLEKPSDQVAQTMGNEHVRALDVSFHQQESTTTIANTITIKTKPKIRHAQVQTIDTEPAKETLSPSSLSSLSILSSPIVSGSQFPSPVSDTATTMACQDTQDTETIEQLKQQLDEEKRHRQRLQATLDDTKDHFEVLSGLAYKKLREIWEEKLRWENTCMDLNQQLMMMAQQPEGHLHPSTDDLEDINSVLDNVSVLS